VLCASGQWVSWSEPAPNLCAVPSRVLLWAGRVFLGEVLRWFVEHSGVGIPWGLLDLPQGVSEPQDLAALPLLGTVAFTRGNCFLSLISSVAGSARRAAKQSLLICGILGCEREAEELCEQPGYVVELN